MLAAASGGLAYAIAITGGKNRRGGHRDYSDPGKFEVPKYASIGDMEIVSLSIVGLLWWM